MKPIKFMLTGGLLILLGPVMVLVDNFFTEFCLMCWLVGVPLFVAGLLMPENGFKAEPSQEDLPQKKCSNCGKSHDFDYPKCPHCGYSG